MIVGIKLDAGFLCKDIFVINRHKVYMPPSIAYDSVVSRDIFRIVIILEILNGLGVKCVDIQNSYLTEKPN